MYLPLTMVDWPGILTQGELESDLGDSFEIQISLSISRLPTRVHKCMELLFTNASVCEEPLCLCGFSTHPYWLFLSLGQAFGHYPVLPVSQIL